MFSAGTTDTLTCNQIEKIYDHISCEDDGSFSPIQCRNGYCVCVNTTTGIPLPGATTFRKNSVTKKEAIESCRKRNCIQHHINNYCFYTQLHNVILFFVFCIVLWDMKKMTEDVLFVSVNQVIKCKCKP